MEGSGETECSKTSPRERNENGDNDQSEGNNGSCDDIPKDGGISSSNSTVEESFCEKISKPSVRPYVRSKMPRLRWTPDLHLRFLQAVERLGGPERATPKLVLQMMSIKGLNIAHVKSHLQMYRSKKPDDPSQGMQAHRFLMEGVVDRNIFNLSQLPLLPSFNRRHHSYNFSSLGKWSTHVKQNTSNKPRQGFYGERMLGSHCCRSSEYSRTSSFKDGFLKDESIFVQSKHNHIDQLSSSKLEPPRIDHDRHRITSSDFAKSVNYPTKENVVDVGLKKRKADRLEGVNVGFGRKAEGELDLNLSLGIESRLGDDEDSSLTLSLNTSPLLSSSRLSRTSPMLSSSRLKLSGNHNNEREASTLDLTL